MQQLAGGATGVGLAESAWLLCNAYHARQYGKV